MEKQKIYRNIEIGRLSRGRGFEFAQEHSFLSNIFDFFAWTFMTFLHVLNIYYQPILT